MGSFGPLIFLQRSSADGAVSKICAATGLLATLAGTIVVLLML